MNRVVLAAAASLFIIGGAFAHEGDAKPGMDAKGTNVAMMAPSPNDSASTTAYKSAMMNMMKAMPEFSGDADVDFMKQMRGHHQAAINMAKVLLANGKDKEARKLAQNIITAQEKEIATIDTWLKRKGA